MKKREFIKILKDFGFKLIRTNKHEIYSNGIKMIPVKNNYEVNMMIMRRTLKEIGYEKWREIR